MAATTSYGQAAHGSSRLEDRSDLTREDLRGIAKRHGPDPSSRYYKLDEQLLRDGALKPLQKLILIDLLHRILKAERIGTIQARAEELGVGPETVINAEQDLVRKGYLLRHCHSGKPGFYLCAYPPKPLGHTGREEFEADFIRVFGRPADPPTPPTSSENPNKTSSENPNKVMRKNRIRHSENPMKSEAHTNYSFEDKDVEERAEPRETPPPSETSRGLQPIFSVSELTENDLQKVMIRFNGRSPAPSVTQLIRNAIEALLEDGLTVTRADLLRVANAARKQPPAPGKDRLYPDDLTEAITRAFRNEPTPTHTKTATLTGAEIAAKEEAHRLQAEANKKTIQWDALDWMAPDKLAEAKRRAGVAV